MATGLAAGQFGRVPLILAGEPDSGQTAVGGRGTATASIISSNSFQSIRLAPAAASTRGTHRTPVSREQFTASLPRSAGLLPEDSPP